MVRTQMMRKLYGGYRGYWCGPGWLILTVLLLVAWGEKACAGQKADRPNIIFILADDLGFSDVGAFGGEIPTPNLDRLAGEGLRFTQFYTAGRCCPTRASVLTGLYQHEAGVGYMAMDFRVSSYRGELSRDSVTLGEVLGRSGYGTYMSGKWHLTPNNQPKASRDSWPLQRGFDRFFGTIHGAESYFLPSRLVRGNDRLRPEDYTFVDESYYLTDDTTREAIAQLEEHRAEKPEAPFFLYLAYHAPHWPLQAPPERVTAFEGRYDAGWDTLREERFRRQQEMGLAIPSWSLSERPGSVRAWESLNPEEQEDLSHRMEVYAAQVSILDDNIGHLTGWLEDEGIYENTLILFFSDNGACAEGGEGGFGPAEAVNAREPRSLFVTYGQGWANASNTPFRLYKHYVHEGGITSPAIMSWPARIQPDLRGRIIREPGHIVDVMPTFIEAAGTRYPWFNRETRVRPLRGISLLGHLRGERPRREEPLFFEHEGNQGIRAGDWKLVLRAGGSWQLYNLGEDRSETVDHRELEPERVVRMRNRWRLWAREVKVLSFSQFRIIRRSLPGITLEDEG